MTLRLVSPMDDEGARDGDTRDIAARLLGRGLRRVDAMARWQGLALSAEATRALSGRVAAVAAQAVRLTAQTHLSPNRHGQDRRTRTLTGEVDLPPLDDDLRWLLALMARVHLGRHTNEGLGAVSVASVARAAGVRYP